MSSSNKIKKYNIIIKILTAITNYVPKFILIFLWNVFNNSESKWAILFRYLYMKKYCKFLGENVYIGKTVNFKNIQNLKIGSNVSIHSFNYIDAYGGIKIGDNVSIANHCTLISSDHTWSDFSTPIKNNSILKKPIIINDDVWVAAGCRILGNVKIPTRTVIGAGAVVNKSLESNSLYAGVPAKRIKKLNEGNSNE